VSIGSLQLTITEVESAVLDLDDDTTRPDGVLPIVLSVCAFAV
jgi:hypothetical protein